MSSQEKEICDRGISFKCMHSKEAIQMLLSHAPLRFSVKEIAGMTDFHRNTIRPAIRDLLDCNKIHQFGSSRFASYYMKTVSEHYHDLAKSIYKADVDGLTQKMKLQLLRSFGKNIVKQNLNGIIGESYNRQFNHDNLVEAILHLKMSYPFTDLTIKHGAGKSGKEVIRPDVTFDIKTDDYDSEDKLMLKISPCICQTAEDHDYICEMVIGALEAGIEAACKADVIEIRHEKCGLTESSGTDSYCSFYIHATLKRLAVTYKELDTDDVQEQVEEFM